MLFSCTETCALQWKGSPWTTTRFCWKCAMISWVFPYPLTMQSRGRRMSPWVHLVRKGVFPLEVGVAGPLQRLQSDPQSAQRASAPSLLQHQQPMTPPFLHWANVQKGTSKQDLKCRPLRNRTSTSRTWSLFQCRIHQDNEEGGQIEGSCRKGGTLAYRIPGHHTIASAVTSEGSAGNAQSG
jgi:hypothetical protein